MRKGLELHPHPLTNLPTSPPKTTPHQVPTHTNKIPTTTTNTPHPFWPALLPKRTLPPTETCPFPARMRLHPTLPPPPSEMCPLPARRWLQPNSTPATLLLPTLRTQTPLTILNAPPPTTARLLLLQTLLQTPELNPMPWLVAGIKADPTTITPPFHFPRFSPEDSVRLKSLVRGLALRVTVVRLHLAF